MQAYEYRTYAKPCVGRAEGLTRLLALRLPDLPGKSRAAPGESAQYALSQEAFSNVGFSTVHEKIFTAKHAKVAKLKRFSLRSLRLRSVQALRA